MPSPPANSNTFSSITIRANSARRNPVARSKASSPRRSNTLRKLHDRQPERAQQKPQAAETLERREVGVLHRHQLGQPPRGRHGVETKVAECRFRAASIWTSCSAGASMRNNR